MAGHEPDTPGSSRWPLTVHIYTVWLDSSRSWFLSAAVVPGALDAASAEPASPARAIELVPWCMFTREVQSEWW
jgi:hypothetical protein